MSRKELDKLLYRSYMQGHEVREFLSNRISPIGFAMLSALVLSTCLGVGHERAAIYQMFSLTLTLIFISLAVVFFRSAKLKVIRQLPRYGSVGKPFQYQVEITNIDNAALKMAWLMEKSRDPRPEFEEFRKLKEPGELMRNPFDRFFRYYRWQWLITSKRLFVDSKSKTQLYLSPGGNQRIFLEMTPLRRGMISLHDMEVILPDTLGMFQRCSKITSENDVFYVLPKRYLLPDISIGSNHEHHISGDSNTNKIGNAGEFVGLRDYRAGDSLRQIHWRSWAKTGKPIVKELEDTSYRRYGLILDTLSSLETDDSFEECVSLAASFATTIETSDSLLDFMFIKGHAHRVTVGRNLERPERLLELLSSVTPERESGLQQLAKLILAHRDELSCCILVLNGWDDQRKYLHHICESSGISFIVLSVGHGSAPHGFPGHWLETGHIDRDLMKIPKETILA